MRRETRFDPADVTDILIAQLSGKPIRTQGRAVVAFSKQDRAACARVASLMEKARGLLDNPNSHEDYEMARLEHAARDFANYEHIEIWEEV